MCADDRNPAKCSPLSSEIERERERERECLITCLCFASLLFVAVVTCSCKILTKWAVSYYHPHKWCTRRKTATCCQINVLTKKGWQGDFLPPALPLIPARGSLLQFHFSLWEAIKDTYSFRCWETWIINALPQTASSCCPHYVIELKGGGGGCITLLLKIIHPVTDDVCSAVTHVPCWPRFLCIMMISVSSIKGDHIWTVKWLKMYPAERFQLQMWHFFLILN